MTNSHILPVSSYDVKVVGVQMQVVGRTTASPDTAALPLAQEFTAEHGSCSHISDVRVQGGPQVPGQRMTGSLQKKDGLCMRGSGILDKNI